MGGRGSGGGVGHLIYNFALRGFIASYISFCLGAQRNARIKNVLSLGDFILAMIYVFMCFPTRTRSRYTCVRTYVRYICIIIYNTYVRA